MLQQKSCTATLECFLIESDTWLPLWRLCVWCTVFFFFCDWWVVTLIHVHARPCIYAYISHLIYPLTVRVVGAPQMISQPVSSIFPCFPLPSGTWRTPGLSIPWCMQICTRSCLDLDDTFFPVCLSVSNLITPCAGKSMLRESLLRDARQRQRQAQRPAKRQPTLPTVFWTGCPRQRTSSLFSASEVWNFSLFSAFKSLWSCCL